jgi:hypothetical protein
VHLQNQARQRKHRHDAPRKRNDRAPHPGASRVAAGRPDAAAAQRSIYDGTDRIGSYRGSNGAWHAFDRRGKEIGVFATEGEAQNAVCAAAEAAS